MAPGGAIRWAQASGFSGGHCVVARDERVVFGAGVVGVVFDEEHPSSSRENRPSAARPHFRA